MKNWLCALLITVATLPVSAHAAVDFIDQRVQVVLTGNVPQISAVATVEAVFQTSAFSILKPSMAIKSATFNGTPVAITPHPSYPAEAIIIKLPQPLAPKAQGELHMVLQGDPNCANNLCQHGPDLTYFIPYWGAMVWYLVNAEVIDAFACQIEITAPADQTVMSFGVPQVADLPDGSRTWAFDVGGETEAIAFYAGRLDKVESQIGLPAIALFTPNAAYKPVAQMAVDTASKMAKIYGEIWQVTPVKQISIGFVPRSFAYGGIGMLGSVLIQDVFLEQPKRLEQGIAHEVAHTWWGNLASAGTNWSELRFLHESFAEYTTWRGLGIAQGEAMRTGGMRMNAVWYMYRRPGGQDIPVIDDNAMDSPLSVYSAYSKGSTVLRTLEQKIGKEKFTKALRALLAKGFNGLTVQAFAAALRQEAQFNPAEEIEQWLLRTGFPRITFKTAMSAEQLSLLPQTNDSFRLQLPVTIWSADGKKFEATVAVNPQAKPFVADLPWRPVLVEIDPLWTAVREIKPAVFGDVSLDGRIDGVDLIEVALRHGGELPTLRRVDGGYDPLYDVDRDFRIDDGDLDAIVDAIVDAS